MQVLSKNVFLWYLEQKTRLRVLIHPPPTNSLQLVQETKKYTKITYWFSLGNITMGKSKRQIEVNAHYVVFSIRSSFPPIPSPIAPLSPLVYRFPEVVLPFEQFSRSVFASPKNRNIWEPMKNQETPKYKTLASSITCRSQVKKFLD